MEDLKLLVSVFYCGKSYEILWWCLGGIMNTLNSTQLRTSAW